MNAIDCADAQAWLSAALDGDDDPPGEGVPAHVEHCAECRAFDASARRLRQGLRMEPVAGVPDIAGAVTARLAAEPKVEDRIWCRDRAAPRSRPRRAGARRLLDVRVVSAAAGLLVGVILGAHLVAPGGRLVPAAADVPARVVRAQLEVDALTARVRLTERGWQPAVPERTFAGTLAFRGAGHLALSLDDQTVYPSPAWVPNDARLVVRPGSWWARGPRACPSMPESCAASPSETRAVTGLEPFDPTAPVPLDLVVPVTGFLRAAGPAPLGTATVAGRSAVGVVTTAAQVEGLLDGMRAAGNLRRFFPGDRVELWLDAEALVPLSVRVIASDDPDRSVWVESSGSDDRAGDELLRYELEDVVVNGTVSDDRFPPAPADAVVRRAGFDAPVEVAGPAAAVRPAVPPAGMRPGPSGARGSTAVRTWVSGRGWIKVTAAAASADPPPAAPNGPSRRVALADGSPAYGDDAAGAVMVHGDRFDVTVTGSVPLAELVDVASSLGIRGYPLPAGWFDAEVVAPNEAARVLPGLVLPRGLDGSEAVAVGIATDDRTVTAAVIGAGSRSVELTAAAGARLGPPLDMAVAAVEVRGHPGRYSAARGELEWVEHGIVYNLRSATVARAGLLAVATGMGPP